LAKGEFPEVRSEEFERLYSEQAQPLFAFLAYRIGDRALAEDLVAETFERALRARHRFDRRRASKKTWLYTIGLNCLRDHQRRAAAERRALEKSAVLSAVVEQPALNPGSDQVEARDAIRRGFEVLSDEEREAIALRYGGDLTVPEIAKVTGERLTTVEGRVYRGLHKLRDEIGGD
jgi:RNA polymerase sigma-70 factor, ECF subfamily